MMTAPPTQWENWAGNQTCHPTRVVHARTVEHIQNTVVEASTQGRAVRVAGAGHSFTPLVSTDDVILDVGDMTGLIDADPQSGRALVWAGTTVRDLVQPLWDASLSLSNQGDIDAQTIAGAVATATHGSGLRLSSFSGAVRSVEYVAADGTLHAVDDSDPHFGALRTAVGTLGIMTKIELAVAPAYRLIERIEYWPFAEVRERWARECATRRHFSYFWGPGYRRHDIRARGDRDGTHVTQRATQDRSRLHRTCRRPGSALLYIRRRRASWQPYRHREAVSANGAQRGSRSWHHVRAR